MRIEHLKLHSSNNYEDAVKSNLVKFYFSKRSNCKIKGYDESDSLNVRYKYFNEANSYQVEYLLFRWSNYYYED